MDIFDFFPAKLGEMTNIKRKQRHLNLVGTSKNPHPPPSSNIIFFKKGENIYGGRGGLDQIPQRKINNQKGNRKQTTA